MFGGPLDIALMGYARSGKDTAGRYLVETRGYRRVSFADPVRESLLALDPIVDADVDRYGDDHRDVCAETVRLSDVVAARGWERTKDEVPEVRRLLQAHGSEAVRGVIGDDTWVRLALGKVAAAWRAETRVVVTDVRFPNERDALRKYGFRLVWLDRPGVEPVNGHASEVGLGPEDADVVLRNDGSEADLRRNMDEILERL